MAVIVNHVDLWDITKREDTSLHDDSHRHHRKHHVAPYHFAPDLSSFVSMEPAKSTSVAVIRAHWTPQAGRQIEEGAFDAIDTSIPNPYPSSICHDKYWCQRRRLFSRFDMGVQLDSEGWFSVTPEIIADHVADCVGELANSSAFREQHGIVVLDAFCGCGGNAIAFGKLPSDKISLVVCVDIDRSKLQKAAYNALLYDIPNHKLIFIECNTMFVLGHCYENGELVLDKMGANSEHVPNMPSPVETEVYAGYKIGGLDLLPPRIDAVFMDPPWYVSRASLVFTRSYLSVSHHRIHY
jgi:trimethylguanosine synthase